MISKWIEALKYFCWCALVTEKIRELTQEPIPGAEGPRGQECVLTNCTGRAKQLEARDLYLVMQ